MAIAERTNLQWDLTRYFSSIDDPKVEAEVETVLSLANDLLAEFDLLPVGNSEPLDMALQKVNSLDERMNVIGTYLNCTVAANTDDLIAQRLSSRLGQAWSARSKATTLLSAWIGTLNITEAIQISSVTKDHEFALKKFHFLAGKQMAPEAESLAEDLNLSGARAWARLYGDISSKIMVDVGEAKKVSMSSARALAYHEDREVRKVAYKGELAAWTENKMTIGACMNGIKGTTINLCKRRDWPSVLDKSLYYSGIDREILESMMGVAKKYFPELRRYLKAKARALEIPQSGFYDIFAPLKTPKSESKENSTWNYSAACQFVEDRFSEFAPHMGDLARRSFKESWIDVEPRPGKRDGAFCASIRNDESLILMNYKPSYGSVSTLAHELGHAYHNYCLRDVTEIQGRIPMTLAETASTFCETLCRKKAMDIMTAEEQLEVLEATLQGATQIVVDITSRFLFESRMIDLRERSDVSAEEMCDLMLEAQIETYGDGLAESELHPYMWAAKPHYYGSDFYNYPYMFGMLFALGLYSIYLEEGDSFVPRYDRLLARSGMDWPAGLAAEFGIDIQKPHFWEQSMKMIVEDVDRFESLVR